MKIRLLTILLSLSACSSSTPFLSKEYVWVQKEDGIAMKAPITYRIRVHWAQDTLFWAQNATDARGVQDLRTDKDYSFSAPPLGGANSGRLSPFAPFTSGVTSFENTCTSFVGSDMV